MVKFVACRKDQTKLGREVILLFQQHPFNREDLGISCFVCRESCGYFNHTMMTPSTHLYPLCMDCFLDILYEVNGIEDGRCLYDDSVIAGVGEPTTQP